MDANGYDIVKRDVFRLGEEPFSSSFFPLDSSISLTDYAEENAFTVWNDRPQGGAVHSDKSIIINVQRYVKTIDNGGLPSSMYGSTHYPDDKTVLNFQIMAYPAPEMDNWTAPRTRTLMAVVADKYENDSTQPYKAANLIRAKEKLVQKLKDLNVQQISFTRLHDAMLGLRQPRSRIRLDWLHVKDNILAKGTDI